MLHVPLGAFLLCQAAVATGPTVQVFNIQQDFLAATGAVPLHPPLPIVGQVGAGAITTGHVTIAFVPPSQNLEIGSWTTLVDGNEFVSVGPENYNITIDKLVYAFGFQYADPVTSYCGGGCVCQPTQIQVRLMHGDIVVATIVLLTPDTAAFFGAWSARGFNRVEIRDLTDTCDDEYFGQLWGGDCPDQTPADVNADEVVDVDDAAQVLACLNGPDGPDPGGACTRFASSDIDGDGDVDLYDFAIVQNLVGSICE